MLKIQTMLLTKLAVFFGQVFFPVRRRIPDPTLIHRICIFKIGALGDTLMTTPMLAALRRRFPLARIDYWIGKNSKEILLNNPDVTEVVEFDEHPFYKQNLGGLFALRSLAQLISLRKYDVIIMLDKHWGMSLLSIWTGIKDRIGFDRFGEGFGFTSRIPYGKVLHEVEYYLQLAYVLGAKPVRHPQLEFNVSKADKKWAEDFFAIHKLKSSRTIAIVPGGAKNAGQDMASRRWPMNRFVAVAKELFEDYDLLLVGGPGDVELAKDLTQYCRANSVGRSTISQTASLLSLCKLVICNDAGPMHMASSQGTATLSIFGPTDPRRKAPLGEQHEWVWHEIDCEKEETYGVYRSPEVCNNILRVTLEDVLLKSKMMLPRN